MLNRVIILFFLIANSFAYEIRDDKSSIGILFKPYDTINVHLFNKYLTFSIDISLISDLQTDHFNIIKSCRSDKALIKIFLARISMIKAIEKATEDNTLPNDILLPTSFSLIDALHENIEISVSNDKNMNKCKHLRKLISQITKIHFELSKIIHSDHSSIDSVIPNSLVKSSVENLLESYHTKDISLPFDLSNALLPDFYDIVRFTLAIKSNKLLIVLEIPVFEKMHLQIFYPKPILIDSIPFLLQTKSQFVIFDSSKPILFSDNFLDDNCFEYNASKFCYKPNSTNECDLKYVNLNNVTEFDPECFKRLPKENIITQFSKDIYLTIVNPITVFLNCGMKGVQYCLSKSSMLKNLFDCSFQTPFFVNEQHPTHFLYKMHYSHETKIKNSISKISFISYFNIWHLILLFIIIISFVLIIFSLYVKNKQNDRSLDDKIYFYVSTKSVDTEV